jgi:hypothetical protein
MSEVRRIRSGDGSLRAAIALAQSGDQIGFDSSRDGQTFALTNGLLAITQNLDLESRGADQPAISLATRILWNVPIAIDRSAALD